MSKKAYISNRFPFLRIGDLVEFKDGVFETDDPAAQMLVEHSDFYNVHIHPRDVPEGETPAAPAPEPPAPTSEEPEETMGQHGQQVRRGSRGTR